MHYRKSSIVSGHFRNNVWIDEHFRSSTVVDRSSTVCINPQKTRNFKTSCWWCNQDVFFYRNSETGGCALFDRLGEPWEVHPCWSKYNDVEKVKKINNNFLGNLAFVEEGAKRLNIDRNVVIISDILKFLTLGELNKTSLLFFEDGTLNAIYEKTILLDFYSIFIGEKNIDEINNIFQGDFLYKYIEIIKKVKKTGSISFTDQKYIRKIVCENKFLENSILLKFINEELSIKDYLNLIARCDLKDKFVLKSYKNNNFMYFLKGISCCEYLLPYVLKRNVFLCNDDNIIFFSNLIKNINFCKVDETVNILMQDNMYDSIVEIIENAFNLEKYKSFDCMLQRGGLFYLVKCIVEFKKNGKDLAELDKINMKNYFCTIRIFRESHFVQYLLNKISFNEICFYYDMPYLSNISY
ncbi:MAG TPA: hypothetical protein DCM65_10710 [Acinetobacter junii]|nr:hypothetical protein [Acinetobacter junii]